MTWVKQDLPVGSRGHIHCLNNAPTVDGMVRDDLYCADWHINTKTILSVSMKEIGPGLIEEWCMWKRVLT